MRYLALGRGRPCFPPDFACPAVLTILRHPRPPAVAYGTLTLSGRPFQQRSADRPDATSDGSAAPSHHRRPTPDHAAAAASYADMVWAPPGSLAATTGILSFPRGTEMFQFPRFPPAIAQPGDAVSPAPGCPIRRSPDRRLPAPPQSISSRGHVLHRPAAPRHPPCAHLRIMSPSGSGRCHRFVVRAVTPRSSHAHRHARSGGCLFASVKVHRHDVPSVEPRGLEPRTSAVQGRRSPG